MGILPAPGPIRCFPNERRARVGISVTACIRTRGCSHKRSLQWRDFVGGAGQAQREPQAPRAAHSQPPRPRPRWGRGCRPAVSGGLRACGLWIHGAGITEGLDEAWAPASRKWFVVVRREARAANHVAPRLHARHSRRRDSDGRGHNRCSRGLIWYCLGMSSHDSAGMSRATRSSLRRGPSLVPMVWLHRQLFRPCFRPATATSSRGTRRTRASGAKRG